MRQVIHVTCAQVSIHLDEVLDVILELRACSDFHCSSMDSNSMRAASDIDSRAMEILLEHIQRCRQCRHAIRVEEQLRCCVRTACVPRIEAPSGLRERITIRGQH